MKKKLASILMAIMCVFALGFCALACGDESELNGTYYMWMDGQQMTEAGEYVFDDGDISVMGVKFGEYELDGKTVTFKIGGKSNKGTVVSDGVISIGDGAYFCKKGKTPPTESQD